MGKTKPLIKKATNEYIEGIRQMLPEAEFKVDTQAFDGFDAWVHILVPSSVLASEDAESRLRSAKSDLTLRIADQTGVWITSSVEDEKSRWSFDDLSKGNDYDDQ